MLDTESIKKEYENLLQQLTDPELILNQKKFEELSEKKEIFEKILKIKNELIKTEDKIKEDEAILTKEKDKTLQILAMEEIENLKEQKNSLINAFESLLQNKGNKKFSSPEGLAHQCIIVEIRAGTGGEEAALFAVDLFKMYSRYATKQGWEQRILDSHHTELGGFKEMIFSLKNSDVFSKMKFEGGVHRVQRIPETEKKGRVHTSTASVAVLPSPQKTEIKIKPEELKIDFYRSSGPGGQYVNKRETAVRITHLSTGLVVTSQTERNQLQNKENALTILEARLLEKKQKAQENKISGERKTQIKWAKRCEKIRTYNFPQNRVTDHRIKKNRYNLEKIMDGKLDKIIETLQKELKD